MMDILDIIDITYFNAPFILNFELTSSGDVAAKYEVIILPGHPTSLIWKRSRVCKFSKTFISPILDG